MHAVCISITFIYNKFHILLSLSTRDETASQLNGDYQQSNAALVFNPGDPLQRDVPIQILEDTIIENTERLLVELTSTDPDVIFSNGNTASISILDDDGMLSSALI